MATRSRKHLSGRSVGRDGAATVAEGGSHQTTRGECESTNNVGASHDRSREHESSAPTSTSWQDDQHSTDMLQICAFAVLIVIVSCATTLFIASNIQIGAGSGERLHLSANTDGNNQHHLHQQQSYNHHQQPGVDAANLFQPSLTLHWSSPIMRLHASHMGFPQHAVPKLNQRLAVAVRDVFDNSFQHYLRTTGTVADLSGSSSAGINELFFKWQQLKGGGSGCFLDVPEWSEIIKMFEVAVDTYMTQIGVDMTVIQHRSRIHTPWATFHRNGIGHLSHTHPNNIVSGVYYVKVPATAGPIIFDDPRGPLPPFDNRVYIHPQEGELVLFPSWLPHQVGPTVGEDERISIAFNVPGSWSDTSALQVTTQL